MKITILTKDDSPASTISTQLVLTNLCLAGADLGGVAGPVALFFTLGCMPVLVGLLRMKILPLLLAKAGHSGNDLRVRNGFGFLTWIFNCYCSFIQCFQLQSSKVSEGFYIAV